MRNGWSNSGKKQWEEAEDKEAPDKVVAGMDREGVVVKAAEATVAVVKAAASKVVVAQAAAVVMVKVVVKVAIETRSKEIVILAQSAEGTATPDNEVEDQELAAEDDLVVGLMRQ